MKIKHSKNKQHIHPFMIVVSCLDSADFFVPSAASTITLKTIVFLSLLLHKQDNLVMTITASKVIHSKKKEKK